MIHQGVNVGDLAHLIARRIALHLEGRRSRHALGRFLAHELEGGMPIDLQPDHLILLLGRSDLGRRLGDRLLIRSHLSEGSVL